MLHAGLDLSHKKVDVCLLSQDAEIVEEFAAPPDVDGCVVLLAGRSRCGAVPEVELLSHEDRATQRVAAFNPPSLSFPAGSGGYSKMRP
jgi:hypothetical protein